MHEQCSSLFVGSELTLGITDGRPVLFLFFLPLLSQLLHCYLILLQGVSNLAKVVMHQSPIISQTCDLLIAKTTPYYCSTTPQLESLLALSISV